ncbi:similar to Saccharomyces cerevisiae YDR532C KRE28 Subunit of a kinetochore- microtubule binding complex with Spc105p that bridges centromeric heterochromatin and kinetochore MAPs and motors [Maudiozyma barnettii]|uniref:Spindle pole body component KRE28 n=1 Tax=Maudiozyma barnettii TaxID=61262 RepID=A0A8H2ZHW0_9SACH|nr:Kre28p [Kazachstania barnettii]CAB4255218.1 similar to Saccharomyces cerevisiae YDR532C KRE28 Subunit of a kinetochore- microtubule binding complex with Spc105p that bridges centromeric heterochromatin and kinetochore MAPs and motors [Kazachstania barnettii]CAD1783626.1 similar to Saccharomyces cerevisiae YDR532C KRE28 Subunit of a kinetochore- microtubule binding complex with Spc105p that bridges centromeric heterochromatin and kinetochore MAPs and motors [Kazachstania barnettii]
MNYINTANYKKELDSLSKVNNTISDENLIEQGTRFKDLNTDLLQSVQLLSQDYPELVNITEDGTTTITQHSQDKIIDFECLEEKIVQFNKIIMSLRMIYLEQESLDNFLRYTISSNTRDLPIESIDDPKILTLESEVNTLENDAISERQRELSDIKSRISKKSIYLFNDDCMIKELCIETSEQLEECQDLLEQIDREQITMKKNEVRKSQDKISKITNTYKKWQTINRQMKLQEQLSRQVEDAIMLKTLNPSSTNDNNKVESDVIIKYKTISKLTNLLEKYFLPNFDNIDNLKISPLDHTITFTVKDKTDKEYKVKITLDEQTHSLKDIDVSDNNTMAKQIMKLYYGECNIYKVIYYISIKM